MRLIKSYSCNIMVPPQSDSKYHTWDNETVHITEEGGFIFFGKKIKVSKELIEDLYKEFCE